MSDSRVGAVVEEKHLRQWASSMGSDSRVAGGGR
jgi:hypothetical protein